MHNKYTFIIVPNGKSRSRKFTLPARLVRFSYFAIFLSLFAIAFVVTDYIQLRHMRENYLLLTQENKAIRGEARILMTHLQDVKSSLRKVKEYTTKLGEITNIQTATLSKKTGIQAIRQNSGQQELLNRSINDSVQTQGSGMPNGLEFDRLVFKPVFDRLNAVTLSANHNAFDLQNMIASAFDSKTLLSSIPSMTPVDGWVTSGFGVRMSPFTGESAYHKGIDVAAPVGTPIHAPADGVVAFSGRKDGFGNFVMIAHGYGVVTGYGHNAQNLVALGQVVKRGEQLATIGQTGRTTGPHLHYEIWVNGKVVDPKRFILNPSEVSLNLVAH